MSQIERRAELDGFAGSMTRLREAYDVLNQTSPLGWSPDVLVDAMQTGDRLSYHPETISKELAHFHTILPQAIAIVNKMRQSSAMKHEKQQAQHLTGMWKEASAKALAKYVNNVAAAAALLQDVQTPTNTPTRVQ